ncbi:MAG: ribonuclease R [Verrucomicrobiales bacterium]|nr:ribonuclease R [Verrucomicrobiales bacterium]
MKKDLIQSILNLVGSPGYHPLNKSEMARALNVPSKERAAFRNALNELLANGSLVAGKKSRFRSPSKALDEAALTGRIEFSRDRKKKSAFFIPDNAEAHEVFRDMARPKVFIPGRFTSTALDGDLVAVRLQKSEPRRERRELNRQGRESRHHDDAYTARVVEILERKNTTIVGKFYSQGTRATVVPGDGRLPTSFRLLEVLPGAEKGDVVIAEFAGWKDPNSIPSAVMTRVLGPEDAPGVDMLSIIHRYGLPVEFPDPVLHEAELIDELVSDEEIERREDWRDREVFTIDPADAKDFDDAICVTEKAGGNWELAVHIADVAHYVKPKTAIDGEARKRGNSVYLADRVIPMLPEKLSNGVCSLKPNVERLTHAAILEFDSKGKVTGSRFVSAVIRSQHRYSYEEAFERMQFDETKVNAIEDEKEKKLVKHLKRAWHLASMLREKRIAEGSLDLDFPEVRVILDEKGRAVDVTKSIYDESHQLIEEFMLAANEAVAYEIKKAQTASIYRVHEDPDETKLQEFAELARSFGHQVGDVTHRPELQKLLSNVKGTIEEPGVKLALLKSLRRAEYSVEPAGHYGLSKMNYTHFTSPIRRYADLVVHRVLRRILSHRNEPTAPGRPDAVPPLAGMADIAKHISRTERIAADAEMETKKLKLIEYLEHVLSKDRDASFEATIHEVRPVGAFCELDDLMIKGMIRRDDLPSRHEYFFDRARDEFRSRAGGPRLAAGTRLSVRIHRVNRSRGFVDFVPAMDAQELEW